jgi:hypothetical protein
MRFIFYVAYQWFYTTCLSDKLHSSLCEDGDILEQYKPSAFRLPFRSWDSSVSVVKGQGAGRPRFKFPTGAGFHLLTIASRLTQGATQPPIQCVSGALSLRVKRPGRHEADHSPPSSGEVNNAWKLYLHSLCYQISEDETCGRQK